MLPFIKHPLIFIWLCCAVVVAPSAKAAHDVVKLEIVGLDGSLGLASAVPLGGDLLATNCHAVQQAASIQAFDGHSRRQARLHNGDGYRDLCFLEAPGLNAEPVPMADGSGLRVGMPVYAAGYTNGAFALQPGQIVGLHSCPHPCAKGMVIQTSASFDRGASGGGLFDGRGNLLGILAFRAPAGGDYHFALPADWLADAATADAPASFRPVKTFWEPGVSDRAYFLTACVLGASQSWQRLSTVAEEWTAQEQGNPEAWMALGRAKLGLGDREAAVTAFKRALKLNESHDVALWELRKLEFDLDRDLLTY